MDRRAGQRADGRGAGGRRSTSPSTEREVACFDAMVAPAGAGEPLQYVLGRWGFRTLDLLVDRRVLIPRPETEVVAGLAIDAGWPAGGAAAGRRPRHRLRRHRAVAGRGAWPHVEVWATDASADALAVARANLAGLGRRAARGAARGGRLVRRAARRPPRSRRRRRVQPALRRRGRPPAGRGRGLGAGRGARRRARTGSRPSTSHRRRGARLAGAGRRARGGDRRDAGRRRARRWPRRPGSPTSRSSPTSPAGPGPSSPAGAD